MKHAQCQIVLFPHPVTLQGLKIVVKRVTAQLEVEFEGLAELEQFWAAIPPEQHRAWSQRAQVRSFLPRFLSTQTGWVPSLLGVVF